MRMTKSNKNNIGNYPSGNYQDGNCQDGNYQDGFTLIELLIVLVIIGLVAGLVVPHVLGGLDRAKHEALKGRIVLIQGAIDRYYLDTNRYPPKRKPWLTIVALRWKRNCGTMFYRLKLKPWNSCAAR